MTVPWRSLLTTKYFSKGMSNDSTCVRNQQRLPNDLRELLGKVPSPLIK